MCTVVTVDKYVNLNNFLHHTRTKYNIGNSQNMSNIDK